MRIAFINFKDFAYGGYLAFLSHLMPGLEKFGDTVEFFYIATRPKKVYQRLKIKTRPIDKRKIPAVLNSFDLVINPSAKAEKSQAKYIPLLDYVTKPKMLVVHDPPELSTKGGLHYCLDKFNAFLFIRPAVLNWFLGKYFGKGFGLCEWLPHPYHRQNPNNEFGQMKRDLVVDLARIDWDKHQDVLLRAAKNIRAEVRIYSGFINPMYVYHKCKDLDWKSYYGGKFNNPMDVLKEAKIMVDLSAIQHDGGGTQYTFLEAMDAEAVPVVSEKWITDKAAMKDGQNCVVVQHNENGVAVGINDLLADKERQAKIVENNYKLLEERSWKSVIPKYQEYFRKVVEGGSK